MKMTRAALEALLDSMNVSAETEVQFFPSKVSYAAVDPEAVMVGRTTGLHTQGVFVKAV